MLKIMAIKAEIILERFIWFSKCHSSKWSSIITFARCRLIDNVRQ